MRVAAYSTRDLGLFGSAEQISRRYLGRYLPSQALYRTQAPEDTAYIVVGYDDPDHPAILRWQPPTPANPDPGPGRT